MRNVENNGFFDYENSKRRKVKVTSNGSGSYDEGIEPVNENVSPTSPALMKELSAYMSKEQERWATPLDAEKRKADYIASARDYIVPEDNELRRRRQFVMSDKGVKDATESYYNNSVKGIFDKEKAAARERGMDAYKKAVSVPGADPVAAAGAMRSESDPRAVVHRTMQQLPSGEIDDIAGSYARYAGLSPEKYRKNVLEPAIEQRLMGEYVAEATPKSSTEYIARSAFDNSLTGKLVNLGQKAYSPHSSQQEIGRAGLSAYNANRLENLAAGIGSLAVDIPAFAAIGSGSSKLVGDAVSKVAKGMSANLVKKYASRGMAAPEAERIIKRAIVGKMGAKIAQGSATQGLTLGSYDAANSVADDLLMNDGIDIGKAADAYAHGLTTGIAVGAVGTPLKELSRGLTGGKKVAASAGTLGAESAVFTMSSNAGDLLSGVDIEPIDLLYDYGESVATLGAMKLAHWRPRGGSVKLGADGRLKQKLRLSAGEAREVAKAGIDPRVFISELEDSFKNSARKNPKGLEGIKNDYLTLMNSGELSAATRSKLLYLVENKVTSTPPVVVDCMVQELGGDAYRTTLLDANGRKVSTRDFGSIKDLKTFLIVNRSELRKNKIATCEEALLGKHDSENFFRQAGRYADEVGADINEIAEAIYKKANNEPLNVGESKMLSDISQRASYGDKGVGVMLYNIRKQLEREYNLNEGSLLAAVNRKAYHCSEAENKALDKYLNIMQKEVKKLEQGTIPARRRAIEAERLNSPYGEMGNEEIKKSEKQRYVNFVNSDNVSWLNQDSYSNLAEGSAVNRSGRIRVPERWDKGYAWSYYGTRNSHEDIKRYKERADEIARSFGTRFNYLFDESELKNIADDAEYNNKVRATGWLDNSTGEIYLNLPNIKDIKDLESTIAHEVVGHRGLSNLFGNYIFDLYEDIYKMADEDVRKGIRSMEKKYAVKGYIPVEEYLAHLSEKASLTRKERTFIDKVKEFINRRVETLQRISSRKNKVSTKQLCNILAAHHDAMLKKIKPDDYRARVFKDFPSARKSVNYYDNETFDRDIKQRVADKTLFEGTPDYLLPDKKLIYEDYLPKRNGGIKGDNSYRFIGERGAKNISKSDNVGMNEVKMLEKAKQMEKEGAKPHDIWLETSWARGADGMWRGEIDYATITVNDFVYNQLREIDAEKASRYKEITSIPAYKRSAEENEFIEQVLNMKPSLFNNLRVRDVVSDSLLYAAYPELAHIPVKVVDDVPEMLFYDATKKTLYIGKEFVSQPLAMFKTIVKPLQQMIQHYEGFENSYSLYKANVEDAYYDEYENATFLIRMYNNAGSGPDEKLLIKEVENIFHDLYGMSINKFCELFPTLDEYMLAKMNNNKPLSMSGNVELRNVLKRHNMSEMDRIIFSPVLTEDYPRKSQVTLKKLGQMKKLLTGPIDMIYDNVMANQIPRPMRFRKTAKKMNELNLTPLERKILESQYDRLTSRLMDIYIAMRDKHGIGRNEIFANAADLLDALAMKYIEDVEKSGMYNLGKDLKPINDLYGSRSFGVGRNNKYSIYKDELSSESDADADSYIYKTYFPNRIHLDQKKMFESEDLSYSPWAEFWKGYDREKWENGEYYDDEADYPNKLKNIYIGDRDEAVSWNDFLNDGENAKSDNEAYYYDGMNSSKKKGSLFSDYDDRVISPQEFWEKYTEGRYKNGSYDVYKDNISEEFNEKDIEDTLDDILREIKNKNNLLN